MDLTPQTATLMFTVSGIMAAISMPIIGRMLDRFRSNLMFAGGLLVMSTSLLSVTFVEGVYIGVMYAAVFGINNGVTMTFFFILLAPVFWPKTFGEYPGNRIDDNGGRGFNRSHTLGDSSRFYRGL